MHPDRKLDEYAARQYGTFSLNQAHTAGFTPKMVHRRVEKGAWIRLAPSVYALASASPKWERQMAAALLTRSGSVAAGRSAAYIHAFDGFRQGRPVIMVGFDGNARSQLATVIRTRRFNSVSTVRKRGFNCTSEAETIITLARELDPDRLEALVDFVLARQSCSAVEIAEVIAASAGTTGLTRLRPIIEYRLPDAYQPPTSELERLVYSLLDHPLLPPYQRQLPISYEAVDATVDAFIPAWRLIVEGDGRRWHTRRADHDRDRLRDNEATAHGLAVLRFTYEMLRNDTGRCLDTLVRTGRVRAAS